MFGYATLEIRMGKLHLLYLLDQFPVISQVFVLNEITGFIDLGYNVHIISMNTPHEEKIHNTVKKYHLLNKTTYFPRIKIVEKGVTALLANNTLTMKEKIQLLNLCHDKYYIGKFAIKWFLSCLAIINIISDKKIDHVHCHFAYENVKLAYIIHQVIKIPYTFTAHANDIFVDYPYKDITKWAEGAKKVITISEFNKNYMHNKFKIPLEKIEIIPCSKYFDTLAPVEDYTLSPLRIISVSRLVEKKGYPYLIKACKILKDRGIKFCCILHGEGDERQILEKLIKENGLEKEVTLGTALTHDEVIEFMKTGSVFVLPCIRAQNNDMDGLPNVLLESMAMEIPTISTDITGIPELIKDGENGIIVAQGDPAGLAEAIIKVKENPHFADRIRKKGRERVLQEFDVHKNVRQLAEIFEQ